MLRMMIIKSICTFLLYLLATCFFFGTGGFSPVWGAFAPNYSWVVTLVEKVPGKGKY